MSSPPDLIIRPVLLQDAEALWMIARQEGVIETTIALPSLRLEQRMKSISALSENDHYMVAERAAEVIGVAGLTVGTGHVRHCGSLFVYVARQHQGQGIGTCLVGPVLRKLLQAAKKMVLCQVASSGKEGSRHFFGKISWKLGFPLVEEAKGSQVPFLTRKAELHRPKCSLLCGL
jgi:GNAT superfamily N-acetyltransferase